MLTHSLILALVTQLATIEGQVRDARTHNAISLASVEVWSLQTPVDQHYTDRDGRFLIAHLTEGHYTISVSHSGYKPSQVQIDAIATALPLMIEMVRKETSPTDARPTISVREYL